VANAGQKGKALPAPAQVKGLCHQISLFVPGLIRHKEDFRSYNFGGQCPPWRSFPSIHYDVEKFSVALIPVGRPSLAALCLAGTEARPTRIFHFLVRTVGRESGAHPEFGLIFSLFEN